MGQQGGSRSGDTAELRVGRARKRRPAVAVTFALLGLCGLAAAGIGVNAQLKPRTFTTAQQRRIEAWEIAKRWRTTPKTKLFPAAVSYRLGGTAFGSARKLDLTARRLGIAPQSGCAKAAGARPPLMALLDRGGCTAVLRATYADATSSFVLTVGVLVLKDDASATAVVRDLSVRSADGGHGSGGRQAPANQRASAGPGALATQLVLRPVHFADSPSGLFGLRQRQLSWVVAARSYVVVATVGYADGRPRVPVGSDNYVLLEMTSVASGVAAAIAGPLGAPPPVPRCPGALSAC